MSPFTPETKSPSFYKEHRMSPFYGAGHVPPVLARLKTEPTLVVQAVQAVIAVLVATRAVSLNAEQTGTVLAVTTAGFALFNGISVRPFRWPLVVGAVQAVLALLLAFGFDVSQELQGSILTATTVIGAIIIRQSVTPETKLQPITPVSG